MSAQQPAQNDPQIPDSDDSGKDQPLRTRYYYLIMTIMVVIGVVIDIAIFIGIITNAEGRVRIPYLVFILPVVGALAAGRFAAAAPPVPATPRRRTTGRRTGRRLSPAQAANTSHACLSMDTLIPM